MLSPNIGKSVAPKIMPIISIMTEINLKLFFPNINKIPKKIPIQDDLEFVKIVDIDIPKLKDGIKEFANAVYGKSHIIDKVVDGLSEEDLKNGEKVKRALIKLYYTHYAKAENVDHFIFVNTSIKKNKEGEKTFAKNNSRYRLFSADKIEALVDSNQMILSSPPSIGNLYPTLNTI